MFANCVDDARSRFWIWKFFPPTCNKFDVEWNWNSKISQNVQNLGFLEKKDGFFEKNVDFFKEN